MIFGPDVSDYQGAVDWRAVRGSGRLFGFAKATEGRTFVADTFEANRSAMAAAGLVLRGLYHFARPDRNSAAAEAEHFLATVIPLESGEVAVLDLESGNIGHRETGAWALAWLEAVERATGRTPWVYSYAPFLASIDTRSLTRFPLWIAGYGRNDGKVPGDDFRPRTDRWARAVVWQYTSNATVPGIAGRCDDNLFEGTESELPVLAGGIIQEAPVAGLDHLHPVFAERVANACRARGTTVYSGARSTERQRQLYEDFLAGRGNPANAPGTSWHEYGDGIPGGRYALAVDFAEPYPHGEPGLIFPINGEPWHAQPAEIPEKRRTAGAESRLSAPTPPHHPEVPEVSKIAYPLQVDAGERRRLPIVAIGGGFGWTRASVTFASPGVDVRRAVVGPNERPIEHLSPTGPASSKGFDGRWYVDLRPGDEWIEIELGTSPAGTLDLYVEAADG